MNCDVVAYLKMAQAFYHCRCGGFFIGRYFYKVSQYNERQQGVVRQFQQDILVELERGKDGAQTRSLSDYVLCMHALRRRGLRSPAECEQLRGLAAE